MLFPLDTPSRSFYIDGHKKRKYWHLNNFFKQFITYKEE